MACLVSDDGMTALSVAASRGCLETIDALIRGGAQLEPRSTNGYSPLYCAVVRHQPDAVSLLAQYGASLRPLAHMGLTPLHWAVRQLLANARERPGWKAMVVRLVQEDTVLQMDGAARSLLADRDLAGLTPLAWLVSAILERRDESLWDEDGSCDTSSDVIEVLRLLLSKTTAEGFLAQDKRGDALLWHFVRQACMWLCELRSAARKADGAACPADDACAALLPALESFLHMLCDGTQLLPASINFRNIDGIRPLSWALAQGATDVARLLIDRGADVRLAAKDGLTALHIAARTGNVEAAKLLLMHGADACAVTKARAGALARLRGMRSPALRRSARRRWTWQCVTR